MNNDLWRPERPKILRSPALALGLSPAFKCRRPAAGPAEPPSVPLAAPDAWGYWHHEHQVVSVAGNVSDWGDLTGSEHHWGQSTEADQPTLTDDGVLFDSTQFMELASSQSLGTSYSVYWVINPYDGHSHKVLMSSGSTVDFILLHNPSAPPAPGNINHYAGGNSILQPGGIIEGELALYNAIRSGSDFYFYKNNSLEYSGTSVAGTNAFDLLMLGAYNLTTNRYKGLMLEKLICTSAHDSTARNAVAADMMGRNGLS